MGKVIASYVELGLIDIEHVVPPFFSHRFHHQLRPIGVPRCTTLARRKVLADLRLRTWRRRRWGHSDTLRTRFWFFFIVAIGILVKELIGLDWILTLKEFVVPVDEVRFQKPRMLDNLDRSRSTRADRRLPSRFSSDIDNHRAISPCLKNARSSAGSGERRSVLNRAVGSMS